MIAGVWRVKFKHWTWEYTLTANGGATWRDPLNGKTGSGKWGQAPKVVFFTWTGSNTKESWNLPVSNRMQGWIDASYGAGPAQVEKLTGAFPSAPSPAAAKPAPEGQLDLTACWAACYTWWLKARQQSASQLTILNEGMKTGNTVRPDGTIDLEGAMRFLAGRHQGWPAKNILPGELKDVLAKSKLPDVPILIGFASSVLGGHMNVIHSYDAATGEVSVMEPWHPDPQSDPAYVFEIVQGQPVCYRRSDGSAFKFTGAHVKRPVSYYESRPLRGRLLIFGDAPP
jgi:hypothetical protein